ARGAAFAPDGLANLLGRPRREDLDDRVDHEAHQGPPEQGQDQADQGPEDPPEDLEGDHRQEGEHGKARDIANHRASPRIAADAPCAARAEDYAGSQREVSKRTVCRTELMSWWSGVAPQVPPRPARSPARAPRWWSSGRAPLPARPGRPRQGCSPPRSSPAPRIRSSSWGSPGGRSIVAKPRHSGRPPGSTSAC